ncbi:Xaa-Pro aminopeptidase [Fictibacillus barbaricus]|uniref:Xaa-Pro aminopeptidase n=1 Tax=Fictibacillus barbaricus TaxID=182136 RepID=A0ABU1TUZ4_9BACL|nr:Xaa-Pro aminopeptidase [Fictibacillus barbaricus]
MRNKKLENYVLHEKSNQFYWEGSGQLSIKTFTNGNAFYKTNNGFFTIEDNRYLLLNKGHYTIEIDDDNEVESFCVFFKDGLAEEILSSLQKSTNNLLSDPFKDIESIGFFEKTYQMDQRLLQQINTFKGNLMLFKSEPLWYEEQFYKIMEIILF